MKTTLHRIQGWYQKNLGKLVLFFILIELFTLTIMYVPYLNLLFIALNGFALQVIFWYAIFLPSVRLLVYFSLGCMVFGYSVTFIRYNAGLELAGILLFTILVLLFVTFLKDYISTNNHE
ncbi:MAG: hypothetical protein ACD_48C00147G0002 [uncultured bacterium]|nr:MAG: hypothetical protein ACD_48C00147G0002 [uncultured bacterium]